MPLKLNIGISRKVGERDYGSRGASANLELELESGLIETPDRLRDRVRQLFALAKQSVDEELADRQGSANGHFAGPYPAESRNGHAAPNGEREQNRIERNATQIEQVADKLRDASPELDFCIFSVGLNRRETQNQFVVAGIVSIIARQSLDVWSSCS